ncbi:MAG: glycerophosphodiester phosphodiesterase, partial [Actinomycetota bacterium]|nr:glycerophosphodiester phosphodiesterase [Actinomycetota bacterium]
GPSFQPHPTRSEQGPGRRRSNNSIDMRRLPRGLTVWTAISMTVIATPTSAQLPGNPWGERRVLHIAHQGGENEAPSNTLFAFKTAVAKGADVLELDVHATADRHLVVLHDASVDRTTDGTGRVDEMTLEEIQVLDAAYWFVPQCGTCHDREESEYVYRGYATGERRINSKHRKQGIVASDFRIPTLDEVLTAFPHALINIEIKGTAPDTEPYEEALAALLAAHGRTDDTIVVSFLDHAVERFKLFAPEVSTATGTGQTAAFWASSQGPSPGAPNPRYQALQVPIVFEGIPVVTEEFVSDAHASGFAVHVWTIDDRAEMDWLVDIGVDGIMTNHPTILEQVLTESGVRYEPEPRAP